MTTTPVQVQAGVRVEVAEEKHVKDIVRIRREFLNSKHCFCILPLGVGTESDVRREYGKHPELMQAAAVATVPDLGVVGFIQVIFYGMPCDLHTAQKGEAYVYMIAVESKARGKGAGTALMHWAEDLAKQRECTYMSLDVIYGNPALSLYERKGYVIQPSSFLSLLCNLPMLCCLVGPLICPADSPSYWSHGRFQSMKKQLRVPVELDGS